MYHGYHRSSMRILQLGLLTLQRAVNWLHFAVQVSPTFLISDIRALWRSALSARVPECQKLKMKIRPGWH